jgi:hypothetical protein
MLFTPRSIPPLSNTSKEDDGPAWNDHWIEPEQSAHLTKVVMLELEANGFQIVKKDA